MAGAADDDVYDLPSADGSDVFVQGSVRYVGIEEAPVGVVRKALAALYGVPAAHVSVSLHARRRRRLDDAPAVSVSFDYEIAFASLHEATRAAAAFDGSQVLEATVRAAGGGDAFDDVASAIPSAPRVVEPADPCDDDGFKEDAYDECSAFEDDEACCGSFALEGWCSDEFEASKYFLPRG